MIGIHKIEKNSIPSQRKILLEKNKLELYTLIPPLSQTFI